MQRVVQAAAERKVVDEAVPGAPAFGGRHLVDQLQDAVLVAQKELDLQPDRRIALLLGLGMAFDLDDEGEDGVGELLEQREEAPAHPAHDVRSQHAADLPEAELDRDVEAIRVAEGA